MKRLFDENGFYNKDGLALSEDLKLVANKLIATYGDYDLHDIIYIFNSTYSLSVSLELIQRSINKQKSP